jgi:hypothetical protein
MFDFIPSFLCHQILPRRLLPRGFHLTLHPSTQSRLPLTILPTPVRFLLLISTTISCRHVFLREKETVIIHHTKCSRFCFATLNTSEHTPVAGCVVSTAVTAPPTGICVLPVYSATLNISEHMPVAGCVVSTAVTAPPTGICVLPVYRLLCILHKGIFH